MKDSIKNIIVPTELEKFIEIKSRIKKNNRQNQQKKNINIAKYRSDTLCMKKERSKKKK